MKAQVLTRYDDDLKAGQWVDLQEVPDPRIEKSNDVIVRIGGAGVCRTDLHIIEGVWRPHMDPNGDQLLPLIMGHENAGWVEAVGKEVESIKVGDPVIVHPKISGGTCLACRRGMDTPLRGDRLSGNYRLRTIGRFLSSVLTGAEEEARIAAEMDALKAWKRERPSVTADTQHRFT